MDKFDQFGLSVDFRKYYMLLKVIFQRRLWERSFKLGSHEIY